MCEIEYEFDSEKLESIKKIFLNELPVIGESIEKIIKSRGDFEIDLNRDFVIDWERDFVIEDYLTSIEREELNKFYNFIVKISCLKDYFKIETEAPCAELIREKKAALDIMINLIKKIIKLQEKKFKIDLKEVEVNQKEKAEDKKNNNQ